jgi:hypothetical protein
MGINKVQHPPRPAATGATLGVTADRPLVRQKADRLLQHRFREAQPRMLIAEIVHQSRGVTVALEQPLQDPANGQLQPEMLNGRALEKQTNSLQTRGFRNAQRSHQQPKPTNP